MKSKRIKLVLTGGGTRGIYQIGAMRAIIEAGLFENIVSISGCSIGAINAAMLAQYNIDDCYKLWQEIARREIFKGINQYASTYLLQMAKESIFNDGIDINPFIDLFDEYIEEKTLRQCDKEIIITSYNITKRQQEYHSVKEIPTGELVNHFIASARLPFFKPVYINGDKYVDGGVGDNEIYYSNLEDKNFDWVIKLKIMYIPYYIPGIRQNNIEFKNELTISPSGKIGSPIAFTNPSFDEKYEMGYADACKALKNINI